VSDEHDDLVGEPLRTSERPIVSRRRVPERPRRRPSRVRYWVRRAVALFFLVVVLFAAWFAYELYQPFAGSGSGSVTVRIPGGYSTRQIGDLLARDGVVSSGFFFNLRAIIDGDRPKLRAGTFRLRHAMSYGAALSALTTQQPISQPAAPVKITIPEGFTRLQIAVLAHADGLRGSYLAASRSAPGFHPAAYGARPHPGTLEGFLFPATYGLARGENARTLVGQQLYTFEQNFAQLDFAHARARGLSRYDALIIASMVEREAQVPSDRRLVAAVMYNRLRDGMTLGVDATLRYALNDYTRPLTAAQLADPTPYNTRLHAGLPPTPISNPGLASLIAATDPSNVPYLYYVDKPWTCGKLVFATTYAQFEADVNAYNAARKSNGGRAPTRCP
jgi:uncharacterized YceG family protein